MNKILSKGGVAFLFLAVFMIALSGCKDNIDNQLRKFVINADKECPKMLDAITRLDSCVALPGKTIRYYHTIRNIVVSDTTIVKSNLKENTVSVLRMAPEMRYFRENNVNFQYQYNNSDGKYLFMMVITPQDYNIK